VRRFPWLDPPTDAALDGAFALLRRLGAVDDAGVTAMGRVLARLPVHPRIGRLLAEGHRLGDPARAALAAALLAERDPFVRSIDQRSDRTARHVTDSDVLDRVEALEAFERTGRCETPAGTLHRGAAKFVLQARDQLLRSVRAEMKGPGGNGGDAIPRAILAAFPDRVAKRREPGADRGVMVGGRGVRLAPSSGVGDAELFVCVDADGRGKEAFVRQASAVRREWLPATSAIEIDFDPDAERVVARKRRRYEDLTLEESHAAITDEDRAARVLAEAAAARLDRVRPPEESPSAKWLTRVRCLRVWMPELGLPDFDDVGLREALPWLCVGCRSFEDLRRADWQGVLEGRLTHVQRQAVERDAPERLQVPSGSRIELRYESGRPPVLAVRVQEVFGLRETPRVAGGRVRVLLHLLAPNYRPQQVTDDLASFWANTYPLVRKELRARYPKHAWPDDPTTAPAEHRPRRKRPGS
jgi:ATP-dependent helicase HrpB